jgi:general secretion pathway protein D
VLLNNQTLVLGGLIQDRKTTQRTGIPFLNRIPVLGFLFGSMAETSEKTELLLLITPRVVGNPVDAARITEDMLRATPGMQGTMMRAPRLSPTSPETTITVPPVPPVAPAPPLPPIPLMPPPARPE